MLCTPNGRFGHYWSIPNGVPTVYNVGVLSVPLGLYRCFSVFLSFWVFLDRGVN